MRTVSVSKIVVALGPPILHSSPKPIPWFSQLPLIFACFLLTTGPLTDNIFAQSVPLKFQEILILLTNQTPVLSIVGRTNQYNALEFSTDLANWMPLATFQTFLGPSQFVDRTASNSALRFYRLFEVDRQPAVLQLNPITGPVGSRVEILGRFFDTEPGRNSVRFTGATAPVLEASDSRLLVEVPTNATSGPVYVTTPLGPADGPQFFSVSEETLVRFEPLPTMRVADFDIATSYGLAAPISEAGATHRVTITRGMPLLIVGAPKDSAQPTFFYAMAINGGPEAIIPINAASTAETLVFFNPFFLTSDAFTASHLLEVIRKDAEVQAFARVIAQLYSQGGDPLTDLPFLQAYADAVISVGKSQAIELLQSERTRHRQIQLSALKAPTASVYPLEYIETRFLELEGSGQKYTVIGKPAYGRLPVIGEIPFNPVDWIVLFQELDVRKAFPNGREDFVEIIKQTDPAISFPVVEGFRQQRFVAADLLFSRFDIVGSLVKIVLKELTGSPLGSKVEFAKSDAIYMMSGIGPAFVTEKDFSFVRAHLNEEYVQAVAINLISAVADAASLAFNSDALKGLSEDQQLIVKLVVEVRKSVSKINSREEFIDEATKLAAFFVKEALNSKLKKAVESQFVKGSKVLVDLSPAAEKVLGNLGPLKILKKIGSAGQIVERATGLVRTTTLETTFVVIGDPFKLEILEVNPSGGSLGDEIKMIIRGAQFDIQDPKDHVDFQTPTLTGYFRGEVLAVANAGVDQQQLTVRLPASAQAQAPDGVYDLFVNAQGKRGQTKFTLASKPTVLSMMPTQGFAATNNFRGRSFSGTSVNLKGYGFSRGDSFIFSGGVEATSKSGPTGDVTLQVPAGAQSGPITIRRRLSSTDIRETGSPDFTVFGPPIVVGVVRESAQVGGTMILTVRNITTDKSEIQVLFGGVASTAVEPFLTGNNVNVVVPLGAQSGPITVLTPAGQGNAPVPFTLLPGLAPGGSILAGSGVFDPASGGSVVTLDRALAFASGAAVPNDDADNFTDPITGASVVNDPPPEEGDFVTDRGFGKTPRFPVGAEFADEIRISGEVVGNFTLASDSDRLSDGVIRGTLTITGNNNKVTVTIRGSTGTGLIIRGNNNTIDATCEDNAEDGVRIEGGKGNALTITASRNGGNGLTLTDGASGNSISLLTGDGMFGIPQATPNSGNKGNGVLLLENATANKIGGSISGNARDGIRFVGAGVKGNEISGFVIANGGNGVTVSGASSSNVLNGLNGLQCLNNSGHGILIADPGTEGNVLSGIVKASRNGKSGVALVGSPGAGPRRTRMLGDITCDNNQEYGVLVSDIADESNTTQISFRGDGNQKAGLRLEKGVTGVLCQSSEQQALRISGSPVGAELDGADVTNNVVWVIAERCTSTGIAVTNAQRNQLRLSAALGGGAGIVLSGAKQNSLMNLLVFNNQGDGLVLRDGAEGNRLVESGASAPHSFRANRNGLVLEGGAHNNILRDLEAGTNRQHGILIQGANSSRNQIINPVVGGRGFTPEQNGGDGIRIQSGATENLVTSDRPGLGNVVNSGGVGIRITGKGTDRNAVKGFTVGSLGVLPQSAGILVEDQAADTAIGGADLGDENTIYPNPIGIQIKGPVGKVVIQNNQIQSNAKTNAAVGILIDNAPNVLIGGSEPNAMNLVYSLPVAVQLQGPGTTNCQILANRFTANTNAVLIRGGASANFVGGQNLVDYNQTGIIVDGASQNRFLANTIANNVGTAMLLVNGARENLLRDNSIFGNGTGVAIIGPSTLQNRLQRNSISGNRQKGIVLVDSGNREIEPPRLTDVATGSLFGAANAPDGSIVEVFKDEADEGDTSIATAPVFDGRFRATADLDIAEVGRRFQLNATVTDPLGNTSEFGPLRTQSLVPWKLSPSPGNLITPPQTGSLTTTIKVKRLPGNSDSIQLTLTNLPPGITGTFNPNPIPGTGSSSTNATLTLIVSAPAPVGSFQVIVRGVGSISGFSDSTTINLSASP